MRKGMERWMEMEMEMRWGWEKEREARPPRSQPPVKQRAALGRQ
jgi:hypothetical protein